jgi:hypothetical protein
VCETEKSEEEFPLRSDTKKRRNQCRLCYNNIIQTARKEHKAGIKCKKIVEVKEDTKQCIKCHEWKRLDDFPTRRTKHGYRHECKACKTKILHEYYQTTYNEVRREKKKNDVEFKLLTNHRNYIYKCLTKYQNKRGSSISYLGCDLKMFKKWIEYQFDGEMTWENYGHVWSIDHVLPLSKFKLNDFQQQKIAFNWKNLQPLKDNFVKGDRIRVHDYLNTIISASRFITQNNLNSMEYQGLSESWNWLREKLRNGKNLLDDCESSRIYLRCAQKMGNSQQNS